LNLSLGYFAPRSTQHSIHAGSVYEYHLRLGRQRQVLLIPIADERVQVKLWNPLRTRAIPERFCGGDSLRRVAISSVCTFTLALPFTQSPYWSTVLLSIRSALLCDHCIASFRELLWLNCFAVLLWFSCYFAVVLFYSIYLAAILHYWYVYVRLSHIIKDYFISLQLQLSTLLPY